MKSESHIDDRENGFGLIEIVVSMFLLGLLAIAFLPLLVTSMQTTVRNATIATATQLVDQQMEQARSLGAAGGATCSALAAMPSETTDDRGIRYQPTRTVAVCPALTSAPANYPRTVLVRVAVSTPPSTVELVSATTLIYVVAP